MSWLKTENEDLYDPSYNDLIRVAFTSQFNRGRLSDLVSLLSGRNFETRSYETEIAEQSFLKLKNGVYNFINETNFKRFLMIVKSAGFISPKLIRSQNALNFAYIVYLKLKRTWRKFCCIESYVRKWLVYSILTGRYSGSPESTFDFDIKQISQKPFAEYLKEKEDGELSDAFWNASLPQSLDTSVASSPYFHVFLASQVKANDRGFLSKDVLVGDLISLRGDIHHLFPKDYLSKNGLDRSKYNQIANYVYMQSEVNIKVGNKPPKDYFELIKTQILDNNKLVSGLSSEQELLDNLKMNCVPTEIMEMSIDDYQDFLTLRRKLMAQKIKEYYKDSTLLPVDERVVNIRRQEKDWMGQSNVWYADKNPDFVKLVKDYIFKGKIPRQPKTPTGGTGTPRQPDPLKRIEVEKSAIKFVTNHYRELGYVVASFEKDNVGWDLKATNNRTELKLEVKGLSGSITSTELTPNEYKNLKADKKFYRLCIVTDTLTKPKLKIFAYSNDNKEWTSQDGTILKFEDVISARIYS
jgi:hypothetical protein